MKEAEALGVMCTFEVTYPVVDTVSLWRWVYMYICILRGVTVGVILEPFRKETSK
jgi:hypothetical protein